MGADPKLFSGPDIRQMAPRVTVPTSAFRWRNGILQQMHNDPRGGYARWWLDVPTAADDAPNYEGPTTPDTPA